MLFPKLPCISPNWFFNILSISSQHDAKSPTLLLKHLFNCAYADSTMLVVLHPRCKHLFVHALTKCFLRGKTVSSTYLTNNRNGPHTSSLNFNQSIAYDSSVGELTTSLQALFSHYFLNKLTMLVIIRFLRIFINNFCT